MTDFLTFLWQRTPLLYLTQSLWRDEAYSVWIAKDGFIEALKRTSGDFNPPLYYFLLHIWIQLFGTNEAVMRSLSVLAFVLFLVVFYIFSRHIFKTSLFATFATLLAATNPMLVYYAFELRMYSLLTFLSTLSMYGLYTKKWRWYVLATTLGLYTQPYMAFIICAQLVYLVVSKQIKSVVKPLLFIALLYSPWLPTLLRQFSASGPMWIYPVDRHLLAAVLGNLFTGFEGTPPSWWPYMKLLSILMGLVLVYQIGNKKMRNKLPIVLIFSWVFVPLVLTVGISFIKPIFVNRYVIFVAVAQVFSLASFVIHLSNDKLKISLGMGLLGFSILINILIAPYHKKVPIRETFAQIRQHIAIDDLIVAESPLVFYEALYYTPAYHTVLLYNPSTSELPRYVGSVGMPPTVWLSSLPDAERRVVLIKESGQFEILPPVLDNTSR